MLRKGLKWLGGSLALLVLVIVAYGLVAMALGHIRTNRDFRDAAQAEGVEVFLESNGIHTDIVMPIQSPVLNWATVLPLDELAGGDARLDHLAVGWGDRVFYLETKNWSDLQLGNALLAISGFDSSLLHLETEMRPRPGQYVRSLRLSQAQYRYLTNRIRTAFATGNGDFGRIAGAHYGRHDAFFAAQGRYSMVNTCNEWVRGVLADTGVDMPLWSPFGTGLLDARTP